MEEIWRPLVGFVGKYEVSNLGRVKSLGRMRGNGVSSYFQKERIIKGATREDGYVVLTLRNVNGEHKKYLHRAVAEAFLDNPCNYRTVNHKDGNPSNNIASNLEWLSYSDNCKHAYRVLGRVHPKPALGMLGIKNKRSIPIEQLKDGIVVGVFYGVRDAERKTGIKNTNISAVCNGKAKAAGGYTWRKKTMEEAI